MPKITDRDTARDLREYESEFFNGLGQPTWTSEHSEAIRASREPDATFGEVNGDLAGIFKDNAAWRRQMTIMGFDEPQEDAYPLVSVLCAILAILVVVAVGLWWWVR